MNLPCRLTLKWIMALVLFLSIFLVGLSGCVEREGPMERAGERVDEAIEKTGDAIEDATD